MLSIAIRSFIESELSANVENAGGKQGIAKEVVVKYRATMRPAEQGIDVSA
jgi:hypothetical protein